ncbi:ABC transporter substrate-binding protein [Halobacteria archaeon AArc-dxtr1]|nr:ABC transporter substrate-binding protein [Halobacteria archaeon AArc-dxtr1]
MSELLADGPHSCSRRSFLASGAVGATVATSGCIQRLRNAVTRDPVEQLSLTITTLPSDDDREGVQIARYLQRVLEDAGIDVSLEVPTHSSFLRTILINHDFDCFVARHPGSTDPDFLYEALFSQYAPESGWQNPYGFTNLAFDEFLEEQRHADGAEREDAVERLLEAFLVERPFVPICVPEENRVVRTDRFDGWDTAHPATRLGLLELEPLDGTDQLRTTVIDARLSQNLNPLAAEFRNRGTVVDLLYDSLATDGPDGLVPWLAEEWEWDEDGDGGGTLAVTLRDDLTFHDGEPLTADDVAFTYEFIADTSRGDSAVASPSSRYRGLASAVVDAAANSGDERSLTLSIEAGEAVAERALTVPILPEHIWDDRAEQVTIPGVQIAQGTTEALIADNIPAVGSGAFQFDSRTERQHLTLERFDDHFTQRGDVDLPSADVESIRFQIDPRSTSAIEIVADDAADVTLSTLETYAIDAVEEGDGVELLESPSPTFYHVGFNARSEPFSNPHVRRAVSQLVDREHIVETIFEGYASPTAVPVAEEWVPDDLAWDGADPVAPFLGTDGEIDASAVQEEFTDVGFAYDEGGDLLVRR